MKILLVHGAYQQKGGEEIVVEQEAALLARLGHHVELFSFENSDGAAWPKWKQALTLLWNPWCYWAVRRKILSFAPDVIHTHNLFPFLSPSVIWAAAHCSVPLVATLHNYRLVCANGLFLRQGRPCEDCAHQSFPWPAVEYRCYRQSRLHSFGVALSLWLHRLAGTWKKPARLVAPTDFAATRLNISGVIPQTVSVKPHFVPGNPSAATMPKEPILLFVGRLAEEKGITVLLDAWKNVTVPAQLHIVGDGPLSEEVRAAALADNRITLHGALPPESVNLLMLKAAFVVVPSLCYETMSRVVMEAFAASTAVIAPLDSAPGSLVQEGESGHRFASGNPEDLARVVNEYMIDRQHWQELGRRAYEEYSARFSEAQGGDALTALYQIAAEAGA